MTAYGLYNHINKDSHTRLILASLEPYIRNLARRAALRMSSVIPGRPSCSSPGLVFCQQDSGLKDLYGLQAV